MISGIRTASQRVRPYQMATRLGTESEAQTGRIGASSQLQCSPMTAPVSGSHRYTQQFRHGEAVQARRGGDGSARYAMDGQCRHGRKTPQASGYNVAMTALYP